MRDRVVELGRHPPTVGSVISRLGRYQEKIRSITCVVTWEDESVDVFYNTKSGRDLAFEHYVLGVEVGNAVLINETTKQTDGS